MAKLDAEVAAAGELEAESAAGREEDLLDVELRGVLAVEPLEELGQALGPRGFVGADGEQSSGVAQDPVALRLEDQGREVTLMGVREIAVVAEEKGLHVERPVRAVEGQALQLGQALNDAVARGDHRRFPWCHGPAVGGGAGE